MHAPWEETEMEDENQTTNEEDPFIRQAPLIVETIIEAAQRIRREAKLQQE